MTLKETRQFMYKQMLSLEKGEISIEEALTQSKLVARILESYNSEIKAIELAKTIGKNPISSYKEALTIIEG